MTDYNEIDATPEEEEGVEEVEMPEDEVADEVEEDTDAPDPEEE